MKKEQSQTGQEMIRTILQDGVDFEVTSGKKSRKFRIYPIKLGTLFQISKIILTMKPIDAKDTDDLFAIGIQNIIENKDKILEIVALAIFNQKNSNRFKKWELKRYLNNNLTAEELRNLLNLVITQMDVTDFLASSVSIKRINLIETANQELSTTGKSLEAS